MLKTIKQIVEEEFNLPDISKRTRKHPYPEARAIYYAVAKEIMPQSTYGRIANFISREHSTALQAVRKMKYTYLRDSEFQILHQKVMDRVVMELEDKEGFSEIEILRQENIELKRKLEKLKKMELWNLTDAQKTMMYSLMEQYAEMQHSDDMCFHECPDCNCRCNCSNQPCSCCNEV